MPILKRKVFAYITYGNRLLVFSHPYAPEAGIQVPAGTVKPGERLEEAVMREAFEETGLADLTLMGMLGKQVRDMADFGRDEIHHRYFYHVSCGGTPPLTWRHVEPDPSGGTEAPIVFDFYWARLPHEVPLLIADHGAMLPRLIDTLAPASCVSRQAGSTK